MSHSVKHNSRGDTIVEVMIAMVVLTLILGAAYAISSRALKTARSSQERGEALKIAESQVENIKAKAAAGDDPSLFSAANFCFNPIATISTDNCTFNGLYRVSISSTTTNPTQQFIVTVQWDSLDSANVDQVVMRYRVLNETR